MKSIVDYHFERKKQLQEYKGDQTRLKSILDSDHGDFIEDVIASPVIEKEKETISTEAFLKAEIEGENKWTQM